MKYLIKLNEDEFSNDEPEPEPEPDDDNSDNSDWE